MKEMKRILSIFLCLVMLVGVLPVSALATDMGGFVIPGGDKTVSEDENLGGFIIPGGKTEAEETTAPAEEETTAPSTEAATEPTVVTEEVEEEAEQLDATGTPKVVVSASDYQSSSSGTTMGNIATQIKKDYASPFGILMGGDYDAGTMYPNASHLRDVDNTIASTFSSIAAANRIMIQGNHETYGNLSPDTNDLLDDTGAHDTDYYGVYAINYEDFGSASSGLQTYLNGKAGYTKPIFVITHQPLHETSRGDNTKATNIFNVLNAAGEKGMKIIFLFGHNHSSTYDDYLGGGAIYLKKGDSIKVAGGSTSTLNFTYMNCGYVGYSSSGADNGLTMTTFEIYEDEVIIKRYDAKGLHNLKSKGVATSGYAADTNEYGSAVLSLTDGTSTIKTLAETETGSGNSGSGDTGTGGGTTGGSGNVYTLDTDGIDAGEEYLIVSTGSDGTGSALTNNNGASTGTTVTISGGMIELDNANAVWVFSGSEEGTAVNGSTYIYPSSTNGEDPVLRGSTCDLIFTHEGNGEYTIQRDSSYSGYYVSSSSDWTYSSSETSVYLFKKTGTGTGGGSTGGGSVSTSGGDWVTISSGVGATIYTLDTDGLNAGEDYLIVDTSTVGNGNAMTNTNGEATNTVVTITTDSDGNIIAKVEDPANVTWTTSGSSSSANFANGDYNIYLSYNDGVLHTSTRSLKVTHNGDGEYTLKRDSRTSGYYVQYSSSDGWDTLSTSENSVYLYRKTGSESAGDAEYAKIDGELSYTVARGATAEEALAAVMNGIDVLTSANADGSNPTTLEDGDNSESADIRWVLATNYDGSVPGEYAVTITYKGKILGVAKVIVPEATINGITVDPASGAVTVGASESALVGATITVNVADDEGEDFTVPVTVGMLEGDFDTDKVGVYENLTVNYNGFTYEGFTLTVKEKVVNNYPSYPNEGAVKVEKHAHGIDFQKTGVAQVELAVSGVPMNQGVDVLLILDTSSSMGMQGSLDSGTRIEVLRDCVNALIENLQKDRADGSKSHVDIAIVHFNGYTGNKNTNYIGSTARSTSTLGGQLTDGWVDIHSLTNTWADSNIPDDCSGTNYDHGLLLGYDMLQQKQIDDPGHKQFVLFMSDGAPFQYNGVNSNSVSSDWENWILGSYTQAQVEALSHVNNPEFYYGNNNGNGQKHRVAEAIKGAPENKYEIVKYSDTSSSGTAYLTEVDGLGATMYSVGLALEGTNMPTDVAGQEAILKTIASSENVFYSVTSAAGLQDAFDDFAGAVLYAAENAVMEDQLGTNYNIQLANTTKRLVDGEEFVLNPAPTMEVREYTIWTRAELEDENGNLSEENAKKVGTRKTDAEGNLIYNPLEVVKFNAAGTEAYLGDDTTNVLVEGVICANTFWYNTNATSVMIDADGNAETGTDGKEFELQPETFLWKIGTIKSKEIALSYFVYLDDSLEGDASAGSYDTNNYAILSYDNYLGNRCEKKTESPQMAWLSANVSYAYYLVNKAGTPVNANGEEVTFANREIVVHPTKYGEIKLNTIKDVENLAIASTGILDEGNYALFDYDAEYILSVNSDATGGWEIKVGNDLPATTYVTNFSDTLGFTKATTSNSDEDNYDYTKTVVWFAVVWEPKALDDTVVIDYGLPVEIHVLTNDFFGDFGTLEGVAAGIVTNTDNNVRTNEVTELSVQGNYGTAEVIKPSSGANDSNSVIRYTPKDMQMTDVDVFTYSVDYTNTKLQTNNGYYYGTVTVIPATTIYYEDDFVDLSSETWDYDADPQGWVENGVSGWTIPEKQEITQDEDRPGDINYAFDTIIDANNVYGHDSAYAECSTYSLDQAAKATVDYDNRAKASFTFWGTGFDVISATSTDTGTIVVDVFKAGTSEKVHSYVVDTYYGYKMTPRTPTEENPDKWKFELKQDASALYQVPVIKVSGLTYDQYDVVITAQYSPAFDPNYDSKLETEQNSYDFYLDAIRIYDPAGSADQVVDDKGTENTEDDITIKDIYNQDNEAYPVYQELRNAILSVGDTGEMAGVVFIDGIGETASVAEYKKYGPNNEVYLQPGQAIIFTTNLGNAADNLASLQVGLKAENGAAVTYYAFDASTIKSSADLDHLKPATLNTATDMYYDITALAGKNIVIYNSGDGILSITNLKATFTEDSRLKGILNVVNKADVEDLLNALNDGAAETGSETVTDENLTEIIKKIVGRLKGLFGKG